MKTLRYSENKENHKIGRNDPCFCGSGKKYKKCCLAANSNEESQEDDLQIQQSLRKNLQDRVKAKFKDQQVTIGTSEEMGLVSMSDIIVEFAQDLLDMAENYTAEENAITFAIAAWNLAIMSEYEGKDVKSYIKDLPPLQEIAKTPELKKAVTALLLMLVERKHREYAHINRYIGDFGVKKLRNGDFHLNVMSIFVPSSKRTRKPLLSRFLGKNKEPNLLE